MITINSKTIAGIAVNKSDVPGTSRSGCFCFRSFRAVLIFDSHRFPPFTRVSQLPRHLNRGKAESARACTSCVPKTKHTINAISHLIRIMVDRLWTVESDDYGERLRAATDTGSRLIEEWRPWRTAEPSKSRLSIDTTIEFRHRYRVFVCKFQLHYLSHYQSLCRCLLLSFQRSSEQVVTRLDERKTIWSACVSNLLGCRDITAVFQKPTR